MPVVSFGNTSDYLNYPTINPTLDLNFAATKTLDPRVTFSRASSATYVDANGVIQTAAANVPRFDHNPATGESLGLLVEESRSNLFTYSQDFTYWTGSHVIIANNQGIAPDNTMTASIYADSTSTAYHHIYKSFTGYSVGSTYTVSLYAKPKGGATVFIYFAGADFGYFAAGFNLNAQDAYSPTSSITSFPNGWKKITLSATCQSTSSGSQIVRIGVSTDYRAGDPTQDIYIWGAQVEAGSFPTSYIPCPATFTGRSGTATYYDSTGTIQTAGNGVARSNAYFPDSNGIMRPAGLLLESASTNLLTYSEQFDVYNGGAAWASTGPYNVILSNQTTSPSGTNTADKIASSAPTISDINMIQSYSATAGTTYTMSCFFKAAEVTSCGVGYNVAQAVFNLSTGTVTTTPAGTSTSIIKLANGWYRCSMTWTETTTTYRNAFVAAYSVPTGSSSGLFAWGAQLEASPYPTSYIPTTTSTVTRNADTSTSATVTRSADVAQMTGSNFSSWYRKDEGTLFSNISTAYQNGKGLFSIHTGTSTIVSNSIHLTQTSLNRINYEVYNETTQSTLLSTGILTSNELFNKLAASYKVNDFAVSYNGASVQTDNTGSLPVGMTSLTLGGRTENSSTIGKTTISRLTYYPVRLSNDQLRLLTQ